MEARNALTANGGQMTTPVSLPPSRLLSLFWSPLRGLASLFKYMPRTYQMTFRLSLLRSTLTCNQMEG